MVAPLHAGPQPARSSRTGTRCGSLTRPGLLEGSRLLDAPPHHVSAEETIKICKDYEFLVLFTSTVGWEGDQRLAEAIKAANPSIRIAFVGPPVTTSPGQGAERVLGAGLHLPPRVRLLGGRVRAGQAARARFSASATSRTARSSTIPTGPQVEDLDAMPWATKIYKRDMDVTRYNVPFLLHPYIALYSTRGCPAQCTFCLWPQTLSGHAWRKRSTDDVAAELKWAKENFPEVKEFFFDDDTFNIQKVRTIELCEKLKPLNLTWSCTSRVTTDRDTLKAMKDAGCRLLIVGFESGDPQILKNIKKGATVERARPSPRTATTSASSFTATSFLACPARRRSRSATRSTSPSAWMCETIQVSIAHAYPGHRIL